MHIKKIIGIVVIIIDIIFTILMFLSKKKKWVDIFSDALDIIPITVALLLFALVLLTIK